jgi:hypothetical protein
MKKLILTLTALLVLAGSAFAEQAIIYGTLTRTAPGDGIDSPTGRYYIVKTKCPVTVEMQSFEQDGSPLVQVVTSEIQIVVFGDDESWQTLLGKKVRVQGETFAPQNWNHRTPVLLQVDPENGDSIREPAPLAPKGSNERGKR